MNDIRVAEGFAGIGGIRLGLEYASPKFRTVWANERDKYACQIYRKNFGDKELIEKDVRQINTDNIPDFDLFVGGFPCQPHSLAGKRKGFSEERGTVFYEIIRIAKAKRPKMLLLENVKGLLSSEQGRAFGTVLEELGNIGYWCEWKTLNSKYAGVPQNRERVFIIGHLRGTSSRQVFPLPTSLSFLRKEPEPKDICPTVTSRYHKRGKTDPYIAILRDNLGGNIKNRVGKTAWTLGGSETLVGEVIQVGELNAGSQAGRIYSSEGISPTLHKTGGCTEPIIAQALQTDGYLRQGSSFGTDKPQSSRNVRRLTPTECERLQGFPDGWTRGVSDTQRYKTLGNAVTVPVIQQIGELILEALD